MFLDWGLTIADISAIMMLYGGNQPNLKKKEYTMTNTVNDLKSKMLTSQRNAWKTGGREATDKMCWFAAKLISEKKPEAEWNLYLDVAGGNFNFDIIASIIDELKDLPDCVKIEEPKSVEAVEAVVDVKAIVAEINVKIKGFGATAKIKKGVLNVKNGIKDKADIITILQPYRPHIGGFSFA